MKLKVYVIDLELSQRARKIARRALGGMALALVLAIGGAIAWAQQWTTWQKGDVLDADKLNANFANLQQQITSRWVLDSNNNLHNSNSGGLVGIGTSTPSVALDVNGQLIRKIARAHGVGPNDATANGAIASRVLQHTKSQDATGLRITWHDNLRCMRDGASCEWEIKVDGASCTNPGALSYDVFNAGGSALNIPQPRSMVGTCFGIAEGPHTIQVYVRAPTAQAGGGAAGEPFTGWNAAYWSLEVEEVY
jgi:hypothetical protein